MAGQSLAELLARALMVTKAVQQGAPIIPQGEYWGMTTPALKNTATETSNVQHQGLASSANLGQQGESVLGAGLGVQGLGGDILLNANAFADQLAKLMLGQLQQQPQQPEKPALPFDLATVAEALYDKNANLGHNLGGALGHAFALGVGKQQEALQQQQASASEALQKVQQQALQNLLELAKLKAGIGEKVGAIGSKVSSTGQSLVEKAFNGQIDLIKSMTNMQVKREDIAERARKAWLSFRIAMINAQRDKEYNWIPDFIRRHKDWTNTLQDMWDRFKQGQVDLMSALASLAVYNRSEMEKLVKSLGDEKAKAIVDQLLTDAITRTSSVFNPSFLETFIRQKGRAIVNMVPVPVLVRDPQGGVHEFRAIMVKPSSEETKGVKGNAIGVILIDQDGQPVQFGNDFVHIMSQEDFLRAKRAWLNNLIGSSSAKKAQ